MELLLFYKLSFFVAISSASALSIIGHHQLMRGRLLEMFALSQFALLGNLISKLIFHSHDNSFLNLSISYAAFFLGKFLLKKINTRNQTYGVYMVGIYLLIQSIQYVFIGIFPQLDAHMSIGFFGSMVTASYIENIIQIIVFTSFLVLYNFHSKNISRRSLNMNIFNITSLSKFDLLIFSIPLVTSLYGLGFLYTLSFLLIPSLILGTTFKNQRVANFSIALIATISSVLGLMVSILFENISTTSAQVMGLFLFSILIKILWERQQRL